MNGRGRREDGFSASSASSALKDSGWQAGVAFDPDFAVFKVFFLPDGHDLLQAVNRVLARFKGDAAVRRRDDDDDARFADLDAAQPVNDADAVDRPLLAHFSDNLRHRL